VTSPHEIMAFGGTCAANVSQDTNVPILGEGIQGFPYAPQELNWSALTSRWTSTGWLRSSHRRGRRNHAACGRPRCCTCRRSPLGGASRSEPWFWNGKGRLTVTDDGEVVVFNPVRQTMTSVAYNSRSSSLDLAGLAPRPDPRD
jgi:hypothetical protein